MDWAIDTSTGTPILVYQKCSVIESEQANYVMRLITMDQQPAIAEAMTESDDHDAVFAAYKTWPSDIRKKLSCYDLRRMAGWRPMRHAVDAVTVPIETFKMLESLWLKRADKISATPETERFSEALKYACRQESITLRSCAKQLAALLE